MRTWEIVAGAWALSICMLATSCTSCLHQNPDTLREKTAQATADLKQDARAMAQGVREGWSRDHPLDLNSATASQLTSLPGIDRRAADRIIENRPYDSPRELVSKRILSKQDYDRIADRVVAKKP